MIGIAPISLTLLISSNIFFLYSSKGTISFDESFIPSIIKTISGSYIFTQILKSLIISLVVAPDTPVLKTLICSLTILFLNFSFNLSLKCSV